MDFCSLLACALFAFQLAIPSNAKNLPSLLIVSILCGSAHVAWFLAGLSLATDNDEIDELRAA